LTNKSGPRKGRGFARRGEAGTAGEIDETGRGGKIRDVPGPGAVAGLIAPGGAS
jgi:hypothetical protein